MQLLRNAFMASLLLHRTIQPLSKPAGYTSASPSVTHIVTHSTPQKEMMMVALMTFSDVFCWQLKNQIHTKCRHWSPNYTLTPCALKYLEHLRGKGEDCSLIHSLTCSFLLLFKFSSTKACLQIYLLLCSCGCILFQPCQCLIECVGVRPLAFCVAFKQEKKRIKGQNTALSEKVKQWT